MRQSILVCFSTLLILIISACVAPKMKKDDMLVEPNIRQRIFSESPIILYVEDFGLAKTVSDPNIVGDARIGFHIAPILSEEAIPLIITSQVKKAFLKAGFKLDEKENAHFTISGRIERFWVNEKDVNWRVIAKASVKYDLIVKGKDGRFVWGDNIVGRATSEAKSEAKSDATDDEIPTLINALKNSIESIFANESFWKALGQ